MRSSPPSSSNASPSCFCGTSASTAMSARCSPSDSQLREVRRRSAHDTSCSTEAARWSPAAIRRMTALLQQGGERGGGGGGCVCGGAALQASGAQPCPPAPPPELVLRGQLFQNLLRRKPPPIQIDARHSRAAKMSIRKTQRQLVQVRRHKGCERLHARGPALQQAQRGSSLEGGAVQPPARPHATCPHAHRAPARKSRPGLSMCPPALCSEEGEAGGQRREAAWGHPDQLT